MTTTMARAVSPRTRLRRLVTSLANSPVDPAHTLVILVRRRLEADEFRALEHRGRDRLALHPEESFAHGVPRGRRHPRMRNHREIRVGVGHVDLAKGDGLALGI